MHIIADLPPPPAQNCASTPCFPGCQLKGIPPPASSIMANYFQEPLLSFRTGYRPNKLPMVDWTTGNLDPTGLDPCDSILLSVVLHARTITA